MSPSKAKQSSWSPRKRNLLVNIVDETAEAEPDAVYGIWPVVPTSYDDGFRTITYAQLANMVNGLAWWLDDVLGKGNKDVFAYVGPNDARTPALGLAGVKTGKPFFVTSPRNSIEAHSSLFSSLHCTALVTSNPTPAPARPIIESLAPRHFLVPDLEELLQTKYPVYEYSKSLEEGLHDIIMIIHTSGSTGIPKPLKWTQETVYRHHNASLKSLEMDSPSVESNYLGKRVMVTLPLFHGAGLGQSYMYAIPFRNVVITPAAVAIVTAQGLVDALKQTPADVALLVPSVVAELAQSPELLEYCAENLEMIGYIGGDLPQQIGDQVAAVMPLRCQWGASEVGMPPQPIAPQLDPQRDWKYVGFHHSTGIVMEKVGEDLYELVVKREKELVDTQPTFTIAGKESLDEYRTCDLFSPHPTIPNEWAWKARADDIIVFLNGEKTNPITMEQHIVSANPTLLSGAIVIGAQRFQPALLLEPITEVKTTTEQAAFIEKVWPTIEEANRIAPAHARVDKSLVLLTEPARPLVRAGKGTLQRGVSISKYESEINTMYENLEAENTSDLVDGDQEATGIEASLAGEDVVARHIHSSVLEATGWSTLDDHRSFFDLGMDSLQALKLLRTLRRAFRLPTLGLSTIYQNSTVTNLAKAIVQGQEADTGNNDESERKAMSSLLKTYREIIHDITVPTKEKIRLDTQEPIDVILTGSTGTLGSMLLQSLLNRKSVGHIFCLNRRPMAKRQHNETDPGTERITFLQVDLSKPHLGLDDPVYKMLQDRVGLIIHSAWPVNFNLALSAFRPQLAGMVNLFSFAAGASRQPRLLFVSSVGAVSGASGKAATPEAVIESLDAAHTNGYSRSKLISELLCDDAAKHLKLPVSIVRVGQVAGPSTPAGQETSSWSRAEWLPSLVISSMHMGCIPEDLGPRFSKIDWIPSDLMANVIVDLATTESTPSDSSNSQVFNLRNPRTTTWQVLIPTIQSIAKERVGSDLEVVSSSTWLERLEHSARRDSGYAEDDTTLSVKLNPAIRLLDFYRHGLWGEGPAAEPMSVQCALSSSSQLRDMPAVQEDWMRQWAQSWLM